MSKNTGTSELINYFTLGASGAVDIGGNLTLSTIANATTDTDKFLVSDTGIIKYRTGAELLTDIGAAPAVAGGYVPYTGAGANVDLGVYDLTANAVNVNGSGSNAGVINLESNTIFSLVNGYGTIGSGTTNQFNLYQTTGAGVFRGAILSLNSITASATRTFTLPDADGTLALTSSLAAYLPLAGGTLTGALNGTSASFSSSVTAAAQSKFWDGTQGMYVGAFTGGSGFGAIYSTGVTPSGSNYTLALSATETDLSVPTGGTVNLQVNGANKLSIASTGAATFSGNIVQSGTSNIIQQSASNSYTGGSVLDIYNISATGYGIYVKGGGTSQYSLSVNNYAGTNLLTILGSGAATFSSSVTLTSGYLSVDGFGNAATNYITMRSGFVPNSSGGIGLMAIDHSGSSNDGLACYGHDGVSLYTAQTERMRITSSGNVGIGTASPKTAASGSSRTLDVKGGIYFGNTGAESCCINNDDSFILNLDANNDGGTFNYFRIAKGTTGETGGTELFRISGAGVVTVSALGTGTVTATSGVLSAVSDMNLKIEDGFIDNALEKVLNLKPRYFYWNEESGLPTDIRQLGFYAQEVNEVLGEEVANSPKTENENWGIYDRGIIAMLTKAIQEQQKQIQELKNKLS